MKQNSCENLFIISGASKGLGKEIFIELTSRGGVAILIAKNKKLLNCLYETYSSHNLEIHLLSLDINSPEFEKEFTKKLDNIIVKNEKIKSIYLFNNASIVTPIKQIINTTRKEQEDTININLTSTIWITSEVLRATKKLNPIELYIINISSGISLDPIEGWSLYCISKAGINLLTSSIVKETKNWKTKVFAVSINPGAMDTDMQNTIRSSSVLESPSIERFVNMYDSGKLKSAKESACKIIELLDNKEFINGEFIDFNKK